MGTILVYKTPIRQGGHALERAISYIRNPEKTRPELQVGYGCFPAQAFHAMRSVQNLYGKTEGRQMLHYIMSFEEGSRVAETMAVDIIRQVLQLQPDFQSVGAVHTNTAHLHAHVIQSSVSPIDGRKFCQSLGQLADFKEACNGILRRYGVPAVGEAQEKHFDFPEGHEDEHMDEFELDDVPSSINLNYCQGGSTMSNFIYPSKTPVTPRFQIDHQRSISISALNRIFLQAEGEPSLTSGPATAPDEQKQLVEAITKAVADIENACPGANLSVNMGNELHISGMSKSMLDNVGRAASLPFWIRDAATEQLQEEWPADIYSDIFDNNDNNEEG